MESKLPGRLPGQRSSFAAPRTTLQRRKGAQSSADVPVNSRIVNFAEPRRSQSLYAADKRHSMNENQSKMPWSYKPYQQTKMQSFEANKIIRERSIAQQQHLLKKKAQLQQAQLQKKYENEIQHQWSLELARLKTKGSQSVDKAKQHRAEMYKKAMDQLDEEFADLEHDLEMLGSLPLLQSQRSKLPLASESHQQQINTAKDATLEAQSPIIVQYSPEDIDIDLRPPLPPKKSSLHKIIDSDDLYGPEQ